MMQGKTKIQNIEKHRYIDILISEYISLPLVKHQLYTFKREQKKAQAQHRSDDMKSYNKNKNHLISHSKMCLNYYRTRDKKVNREISQLEFEEELAAAGNEPFIKDALKCEHSMNLKFDDIHYQALDSINRVQKECTEKLEERFTQLDNLV